MIVRLNTIFRIVELALNLRHQTTAISLKGQIERVESYVDDLKADWMNAASYEYAMDVTFPKYEKEFRCVGWNKDSALEAARQDKLWTKESMHIRAEFFKQVQWFKENGKFEK
jgi:hypothetical protein